MSLQDSAGATNEQSGAPASGSPGAVDEPKYEAMDLASRGQRKLQTGSRQNDIDADIGEVLDAINGEDARLDADENLAASDALFATNNDQ